MQATLDANPHFAVIQGDIKNGYNELCRESVLEAIKESGKLDSPLAFSHDLMLPEAYVGMGSGTRLVKAPFRCAEGMHQGAVESRWHYSHRYNKAFQKLRSTLKDCDGGVMAIIDDNYTMGPPQHIFTAHQTFGNDIK